MSDVLVQQFQAIASPSQVTPPIIHTPNSADRSYNPAGFNDPSTSSLVANYHGSVTEQDAVAAYKDQFPPAEERRNDLTGLELGNHYLLQDITHACQRNNSPTAAHITAGSYLCMGLICRCLDDVGNPLGSQSLHPKSVHCMLHNSRDLNHTLQVQEHVARITRHSTKRNGNVRRVTNHNTATESQRGSFRVDTWNNNNFTGTEYFYKGT